jgi:hypothetical protein
VDRRRQRVWLSNQLILAPVSEAIKMLKDVLSVAQRAKHQEQLEHLSSRLHGLPSTGASMLVAAMELPALLPSLDFVSCGTMHSLIGIPGKNPCDASDYFWQHHSAMYYDLLAGVPVPRICPAPPTAP